MERKHVYFGIATCKQCGKEFEKFQGNQLFCSRDCALAFHHDQQQKTYVRKSAVITKKCKLCGAEFSTSAANQVFCSSQCRDKFYKNVYTRGQFIIFERDNFQCFYCGRTAYRDGITLHADHVLPRNLGGTDTAGNMVTACEDCNLTKSDNPIHDPAPLFKEISRRNEERGIYQDQLIKLC